MLFWLLLLFTFLQGLENIMATTVWWPPESEIVRLQHTLSGRPYRPCWCQSGIWPFDYLNAVRWFVYCTRTCMQYISTIGDCQQSMSPTSNDLPWWYVCKDKTYHITLLNAIHELQCTYVVDTYSPLKRMYWLKWYVKCIKGGNTFDVFTPELLTGYTEQPSHLYKGPRVLV